MSEVSKKSEVCENLFDDMDKVKHMIKSIKDTESATVFLEQFRKKYMIDRGFTGLFSNVKVDTQWEVPNISYSYNGTGDFEVSLNEKNPGIYLKVNESAEDLHKKLDLYHSAHGIIYDTIVICFKDNDIIKAFKLYLDTGRLITGFLDDCGYKWTSDGGWRE